MSERARPRAPRQTALLIDADPVRRTALGRWVGEAGFAPRAAETAEKARSELADRGFDLVLADPELLDARGLALFAELSERMPPRVTGRCIACSDAEPPDKPGLSRFGHLIGATPPMQRVYDQLLRVASTEVTVFLVGESGTGKELAAELIHGLSRRAANPFVPVNCTLFLDEIAEMPTLCKRPGDVELIARHWTSRSGSCVCSSPGSCGVWAGSNRSRPTCG